jgi:hypothetical protein
MATDDIKEQRKWYRERAIEFVKAWADRESADYDEPSRAGTPKGDPIGISQKKFRAAFFMVLWPNCLKLREISKLCGVSEGVLRVWRTEKLFKDLMFETFRAIGESIAERIRGIVENDESSESHHLEIKERDPIKTLLFFQNILPWLNTQVADPVLKLIKEGFKHKDYLARHRYLGFADGLLKLAEVHDEKSLREYHRRPEVLELTKTMIAGDIDLLVEAKVTPEASFEETKDFGESTKKMIFYMLDILAS